MGLLDSLKQGLKGTETVTSDNIEMEDSAHNGNDVVSATESNDSATKLETIANPHNPAKDSNENSLSNNSSDVIEEENDSVVRNTKTIGIINQKGGVGKSTTAVNLSAALGEMGKRVLLVDLDPQGNATSGFGVEKNELEFCIYDLLLFDDVNINDIINRNVSEHVDLIPATLNLAGAELELVNQVARENRLRDTLESQKGKYDYIFIDCPPSLGLLTINAFVASDELLIPIQCEFYALEGVSKLLDTMKVVKSRLNSSLDVFGVLMTMYDGRTTLSKQVVDEVKKYFGDTVFNTYIPRTVKLSEAPSYGVPITQYDPSGKGSISYTDLAKEVISRG